MLKCITFDGDTSTLNTLMGCQLEAVRGVSGQESFLPGTSLLHRIPLPH